MKWHSKKFRQELFVSIGGLVMFIGGFGFATGNPVLRDIGFIIIGVFIIALGAIE